MSFWKRIFPNKADPMTQQSDQQAIHPFEYWDDDDPATGRRLCRPLLYALQHMVLPQALFIQRPALSQALTVGEESEQGFQHLLSHAVLRCEGVDGWPDDTFDAQDAYIEYSMNLLKHMVPERYERDASLAWVVRMPPPIAAPEAHFVAFFTATDHWHGPSTSSMRPRYFLLERSIEPGTCCVCEWTADGAHKNHGASPLITPLEFANLAFERVASGV